jgi:hypothetical protein
MAAVCQQCYSSDPRFSDRAGFRQPVKGAHAHSLASSGLRMPAGPISNRRAINGPLDVAPRRGQLARD